MVNLASLLLARATEREREFAVSRALGGSAPAVVRATVIEGGLLGLVGGITGALIGTWGTRLLVTLGPVDLPRRDSIALDWNVAAVVIAVGFLLGLIAAAVPAIWAARVSLAALLSTSAVRGGAGSSRMRRGLIVVQVALSLVLLSTGGLVVRSFERLLVADPGFRPEGVLTFNSMPRCGPCRALSASAPPRSCHSRAELKGTLSRFRAPRGIPAIANETVVLSVTFSLAPVTSRPWGFVWSKAGNSRRRTVAPAAK
jgi:hypothetical protein